MPAQPYDLTPEQLRRLLAQLPDPAAPPRPRAQMRSENGQIIARPTEPPPGHEARLAAVLVLIYPGPAGLTLALTRRAETLPSHAGQISFPGGRQDPDDPSLLDTALREAQEELGVSPQGLELLATLRTIFVPPSNFLVHPFVVFSPDRPEFVPSAGEVEEVLEVPLSHLLEPANLFTELRDVRGGRFHVPYFRFGPHKIWGATAAILDDLVSRLEQPGERP